MGVAENLKQISKDSVIYGFAKAATVFIGIFMVPIYTRIFSPGEYGIIDLVNTYVNFVMIFLCIGYSPSIFRFYVPAESAEERIKIASTSFLFELIFASSMGVLLFLASPWISRLLTKTDQWTKVIQITAVSLPFLALVSLFLEILRCEFKKWHYSILSICLVFFTAAFCIYLVVFRGMGVIGVFWGGLIAQGIMCIVGLCLTRNYFRLRLSFRWLREFLSFNVPLILSPICYWVIKFSDRYFLLNFRSLEEVGLYSVGVKLASIISFIVLAFSIAWVPIYMSIYNKPDDKRTYSTVLLYYTIVLSFIICLISVFAREILTIFTTQSYVPAYKVVGILGFSFMLYGSFHILAIGVNISKKTYHIAWTTAVAAVVNLTTNFLLVPRIGMIGSALAAMLGYSVSSYLVYLVSQRFYRVDYKLGKVVFRVILPAFLIVGAGSFIDMGNIYMDICIKVVLVSLFPIALVLLGAVTIDEVKMARDLLKNQIIR